MSVRMTIFATLLSLAAFSQPARAQEAEHRNYVSIGVGFPNFPKYFFDYLSSKDQYSSKGTGPFHLKYEYRASPRIGLGISINHLTYKVTFNESVFDTMSGRFVNNRTEINNNSTAANLRLNFHFIKPSKNDKLDVYAGIGLGYQFGKLMIDSDYPQYTTTVELPDYTKLGVEASVGMRYFFDKHIGAYLEAGFTKSFVQAGVTARF